MSLGYAEKLSYREDVGTVGMSEIFDPPDALQQKVGFVSFFTPDYVCFLPFLFFHCFRAIRCSYYLWHTLCARLRMTVRSHMLVFL